MDRVTHGTLNTLLRIASALTHEDVNPTYDVTTLRRRKPWSSYATCSSLILLFCSLKSEGSWLLRRRYLITSHHVEQVWRYWLSNLSSWVGAVGQLKIQVTYNISLSTLSSCVVTQISRVQTEVTKFTIRSSHPDSEAMVSWQGGFANFESCT
jgi:hypothetical protein